MADIITLNVGGHLYTTTKSTLDKYPDSMLGIMVNGKFDMNRDSNGHPFIDRDGEMFKYILNFLRSAHLALPTDFKQLELLSVEADFYQIQHLLDIINKMKVKTYNDRPTQRVHHLKILERCQQLSLKSALTVLYGRKEILLSLPADIIGAKSLEHLQNKPEIAELWLEGIDTIIRLSEELHSRGWKLLSSVSSECGNDYHQIIHTWCLELPG